MAPGLRSRRLGASWRGLWVLTALALCAPSRVRADGELPWAFNNPPAEGYSIALVSASPQPGSPLAPGASVEVTIRLHYMLEKAAHGVVVLVFQDERNRSVSDAQPTSPVEGGTGEIELRHTLTVPKHAKELRVFIPLVPDGVEETHGEVVLRYPIHKQ